MSLAFSEAVLKRNADAVNELLDKTPQLVTAIISKYGVTAMFCPTSPEIVESLIIHGANIRQLNPDGLGGIP